MKPARIAHLKPGDKVIFTTYVHSVFDDRVELRDTVEPQANQQVWNFTQAKLNKCNAELVED